jgi:hypothetical protein
MDPRFNAGFEEQIKRLEQIPPYDEISRMLQNVKTEIPLRPDAILFLMINAARMIIIPWAIAVGGEQPGTPTFGASFLSNHANILYEDLREIVERAEVEARARSEGAISANIVLSVTGARTVGVRTRALNIWGP